MVMTKIKPNHFTSIDHHSPASMRVWFDKILNYHVVYSVEKGRPGRAINLVSIDKDQS